MHPVGQQVVNQLPNNRGSRRVIPVPNFQPGMRDKGPALERLMPDHPIPLSNMAENEVAFTQEVFANVKDRFIIWLNERDNGQRPALRRFLQWMWWDCP